MGSRKVKCLGLEKQLGQRIRVKINRGPWKLGQVVDGTGAAVS